MAQNADAAADVAQIAQKAGDNRILAVAALLTPALGWVLFNIGVRTADYDATAETQWYAAAAHACLQLMLKKCDLLLEYVAQSVCIYNVWCTVTLDIAASAQGSCLL